MRIVLLLFFVVIAVCILRVTAQSTCVSTSPFSNYWTAVPLPQNQINGASIVSSFMQLTPDKTNQIGGAIFANQLNVNNDFNISFTFSATTTGSSIADGFALLFVKDSLTNLGGIGGMNLFSSFDKHHKKSNKSTIKNKQNKKKESGICFLKF